MEKTFGDEKKGTVDDSCLSPWVMENVALISSGSSYEEDEERGSLSDCDSSTRKRKYAANDVNDNQSSINTSSSWKEACLKVQKSYDSLLLPSLEEATVLFGFYK